MTDRIRSLARPLTIAALGAVLLVVAADIRPSTAAADVGARLLEAMLRGVWFAVVLLVAGIAIRWRMTGTARSVGSAMAIIGGAWLLVVVSIVAWLYVMFRLY